MEFETWVVMLAEQELFLGKRNLAGSLNFENPPLAAGSIYVIAQLVLDLTLLSGGRERSCKHGVPG